MTDDAARHAPRADDRTANGPSGPAHSCGTRSNLRHASAHGASGIASLPELYRTWFNPRSRGQPIEPAHVARWPACTARRTRAAASRVIRDGVATVCRQDAIGRDGWWRTWGEQWRPRQSRESSVRVVLTPRPDAWPT